jgi:TonB family protein
MTDAWQQWEGQVVNGEFHLGQYLGGGENSAVFLTEHGERELQKAAIKLVPALPEKSELQLSQWRLAAKLSHPHLIRLFQIGRCELGNMEMLYVVMEYAEENLSQILPQRPVTPSEAREMLEPVVDALAYVHGQGFIHGHIKPANIMAVEDQLKISNDGLCHMDKAMGLGIPGVYDAPEIAGRGISKASDVWSLGMTMVEALTQRLPVWEASGHGEPVLPETLPAPFLELARHCLRRDPQRRWTVADVVAHMRQTSPALQGPTSAIQQTTLASRRRYLVPAVALGLVLAAVLAAPRLFNRQRSAPVVGAKSTNGPDDKKQGSPQAATRQTPVQSEAGQPTPAASFIVPGKVVHQVLPDVPRSARNTIQGKIKVGVRVRVDSSGNVAGVKLASPGPSRYFAELALKAARRWKFEPARVDDRNVSSEWILRFEFGKTGTNVLSVLAPA